eukprot:10716514-Heterocapsa_arctica.AAC.1
MAQTPGQFAGITTMVVARRQPGTVPTSTKKLLKAEADKMSKPPGRESSPSKPDAKAKAKAKAKAAATNAGNDVKCCRKLLIAEGCPNSAADCRCHHLDEF